MQEILELANFAFRHGATHGERRAYAVFFYRIQGNKVERCFAEFSPSDNRYHWIWDPTDWRECPEIEAP